MCLFQHWLLPQPRDIQSCYVTGALSRLWCVFWIIGWKTDGCVCTFSTPRCLYGPTVTLMHILVVQVHVET